MSLKVFYASVHSILEHDEVKLFHQLGYDVFSPGAYWKPAEGGAGMRPPLPELQYDPELVDIWQKHEEVYPEVDGKSYVTLDILKRFDVCVIMHAPHFISQNWSNLYGFIRQGGRVIWRTIGQSVVSTEASLAPYRAQGLEIVRYSPNEANIPGFIGQDALIRFYKDQEDYKDWNGKKQQVVTIAQHMKERDAACNYTLFEQVTRQFPRVLIGPGSEGQKFGVGRIPFEEMKQYLRDSRCYFYTGTHPASYTLNFMEALMTGTPMVCIGPQRGNATHLYNHDLYEIPNLITHGENGFVSDNPEELKAIVQDLLDNESYAKYISQNGRKLGIKHFNKDMIGRAWDTYLQRGR